MWREGSTNEKNKERRLVQFSWKWFGIAAFLLGWCKHALAVSLPVYALTTASYDDRLMVNLTYWMMSGEWLGVYNSNTFVKGIGFPVFH